MKNYKRNYKLVNAKKFYTFITLLIAGLILGVIILNNTNVRGEAINKYETIVVDNGDNLWDIAEKYNQGKYRDIREFVYVIKNENNIYGDTLTPNMKLRIPKA